MSEDLWGAFYSFEKEDEIYNLLKNQLTILYSKSHEQITGEIKYYIDSSEDLIYEFRITAKSLQYTKLLFMIWHPITSEYPATFESYALKEKLTCADFKEITDAIRLVLSGEQVTGLLNNLLKFSNDN